MNIERTGNEVKFVDLGITLLKYAFDVIRDYMRHLDSDNKNRCLQGGPPLLRFRHRPHPAWTPIRPV